MKKLTLIILGMFCLAGCAPLGLTGNPNKTVDTEYDKPTPNEIAVMENVKYLPVTIKQFESNLKKNKNYSKLKEIKNGFVSTDQLFEFVYKDDNPKMDENVVSVNILVNKNNDQFDSIEQEFETILETLFSSLEVTYDERELISKVKEKHAGKVNNSDIVDVEITNIGENIQMIISSK